MSKEQRDYLLRQQLRAIQEELGEKTPESAEVETLRQRIAEADLPDHVRKEAQRELGRLERMSMMAPDFQVTRSYLELVMELPWKKETTDQLELPIARQILDEDHYDLQPIKRRILEHLAVLKLNPSAKAPILCFVGPPGVGKTSLGQSIARAMGRTFERVSLGGLHDEAELRGHRRTYIGAMPGRIIQSIRRAGAHNPVLMLDEVDKLGHDYRGDPAAALLEILDPAQNNTFRDNYLDLPFDLSKVFFIATANTLDTVPAPLLDRLEILRLAGYSEEEKVEIAKRYLIPRQWSQTGLKPEQLTLTDGALKRVVSRYTGEAGVRQLEQMLGRIARQVAVRFAEGNTAAVLVDVKDLAEMLGVERFSLEQAQGVAARCGDGTGLDRSRRRCPLCGNHASAACANPSAHRSTRQGDARIGKDRAESRVVGSKTPGHRSKTIREIGDSRPRPSWGSSQGWPQCGCNAGHRTGFALHRRTGALIPL